MGGQAVGPLQEEAPARLLGCSFGLRGGFGGSGLLGLGWGGVGLRGALLLVVLIRVARELADRKPERPGSQNNDSKQGGQGREQAGRLPAEL